MGQSQQIERVARAFYGVDNDEQTWDQAPEDVKEVFRGLAEVAVDMASPCQGDSMGQSGIAQDVPCLS